MTVSKDLTNMKQSFDMPCKNVVGVFGGAICNVQHAHNSGEGSLSSDQRWTPDTMTVVVVLLVVVALALVLVFVARKTCCRGQLKAIPDTEI